MESVVTQEGTLAGAHVLWRRVRRGVHHRRNWLQLLRFAIVGALGYAVNLATFAICVHPLAVDYRIAAVLAFAIAVTNNFVLNRFWTFKKAAGATSFEAPRFVVVSLAAFGFSLLVLTVLVEMGAPEVLGQAIAICCATPLNFVGNKLWTFRG